MFVFRNYTIENLFPEDTLFSGYGDISVIPSDEKQLVWFYQAPIGFDIDAKCKEIESFKSKVALISEQLKGNQTLYLCSLLDFFPLNIVDSDNRAAEAVEDFNIFAGELAKSNHNVKYINVSEYFNQYPKSEWINWRFYFISQMIVAPNVANDFNNWLDKRIREIEGARKKCIVLDLDNTLWGGVLGEDGIEGIKTGGDYPGNAFQYFQEALISLSRTGIILTICSKNNETDVLEAWEKNPFIKLKKEHISAWRINWNNKADNIRELAKELNIGLDSMVFIDDNPSERELVKQELPMVAVPDFPKKPYGLMEFFNNIVQEYFRTPSITKEDLDKTGQYKANAERAASLSKFANIDDFIRSLDIKIQISEADQFTIPRASQMTQKTNQFNLTTKRYTEADIKEYIERGDKIFCASVSDKFGDNGITALAIITIDGYKASIDSFLMSCRILGKGIERAFLSAILNSLYKKGIREVSAQYIPTSKNGQVADFYDKNGFKLIKETEDRSRLYQLSLYETYEISDSYDISIK